MRKNLFQLWFLISRGTSQCRTLLTSTAPVLHSTAVAAHQGVAPGDHGPIGFQRTEAAVGRLKALNVLQLVLHGAAVAAGLGDAPGDHRAIGAHGRRRAVLKDKPSTPRFRDETRRTSLAGHPVASYRLTRLRRPKLHTEAQD